jgi:hypothetical protein
MFGRPLVAAAAAAVALLAAGSAHPHAAAPAKAPPLLGIVEDRAPFETLVRLDPKRIRPVRTGRRVDLGFASYTWAFSPDRTRIAFGRKGENDGVDLDHAASFLRIVDPQAMRIERDVHLGRGILQESPAWLTADRVAAVKVPATGEGSELVVADPVQARVIDRRELPFGGSLAAQQGGARFVVLTASRPGIAPVELLVVDGDGSIRTTVLDRISGGCVVVDASDRTTDEVRPGLAVTRDGNRAFVIAPDGLAADVDLTSLAVVYHQLPLALPTHAKLHTAAFRSARILPGGTVSLTGSDVRRATVYNQDVPRRTSAGLWLIDPDTWKSRLVDRYADSLSVTGSMLLATGWHFHPAQEYATGTGLTAYNVRGKRLFRLFEHKWAELWGVYGRHAFVYAEGHKTLSAVDLSHHRITGSRAPKTFPVIVTP